MAPFSAAEDLAASNLTIAVSLRLLSAAESKILALICRCRCRLMSHHPENQERSLERRSEKKPHLGLVALVSGQCSELGCEAAMAREARPNDAVWPGRPNDLIFLLYIGQLRPERAVRSGCWRSPPNFRAHPNQSSARERCRSQASHSTFPRGQ